MTFSRDETKERRHMSSSRPNLSVRYLSIMDIHPKVNNHTKLTHPPPKKHHKQNIRYDSGGVRKRLPRDH